MLSIPTAGPITSKFHRPKTWMSGASSSACLGAGSSTIRFMPRSDLSTIIPTILMPEHDNECYRYRVAFERAGVHLTGIDYTAMGLSIPELHPQVDALLKRDHSRSTSLSIPQVIVLEASEETERGVFKNPQLQKIKKIADSLLGDHCAVLLPGGIASDPAFYGET